MGKALLLTQLINERDGQEGILLSDLLRREEFHPTSPSSPLVPIETAGVA
jgi:hypothetical protein